LKSSVRTDGGIKAVIAGKEERVSCRLQSGVLALTVPVCYVVLIFKLLDRHVSADFHI
jgi:hypothetical protein